MINQNANLKNLLILLFMLVPVFSFSQANNGYTLKSDRLSISTNGGHLEIVPLNNQAIRIRFAKDLAPEEREFILTEKETAPKFKFRQTANTLEVSTGAIAAIYNKTAGTIKYTRAGKTLLEEQPGSRELKPSTTMGQPSYIAEQGFVSPADEHLFGLGQFQDGQYDLRNVSRKLIQVNSQIAIPFLYSSKGYGILWHQYGLTYFNPADNAIPLEKKDNATGQAADAEVTTTAGTQRISQQQALYTGKFILNKPATITIALDLGDMDSRHLLVIDGVARIDQSNLWLPPAVSTIVSLSAGEHNVQVLCKKANHPTLTWKPVGNETLFRSPNAKSLDYVVFFGKNADDIIADYRKLSGEAPMLPLWAYGFWQCRERYSSGDQLVNTVKEFRDRKLPMDVIVQDWQYWGKNGWGVPKFDETNYPNPDQFIKKLHDLHARFSLSVWENLDKKSGVAKPYIDKNLYLANSPWIDIYNPETQKTHWNALNDNLFSKGVDSWWMDATEPENDALAGKQTYFGPGDFYRLTYPLFVSKAVYDGQRATNPDKRVTILTRSAFPGEQRYGTINWSGDIGGTWDSFKRQIVAGLNYSLSGMPYWTTDIGGFFRPGRGQYTDEKYHDLLLRWFQWGAFNPIFRVHGYQSETEPWKYGPKVEQAMRETMELRYRLMPYIYSAAWQIHSSGSTIMRPLVMDFADDTMAVKQRYEYLFGKNFLITPVTEAGLTKCNVYLPKAAAWYDYWTGERYTGGKTIVADAPVDKSPLFVKAGAIIPLAKPMQYTGEKPLDTLEIRVYPGANGSFELYEDQGDGYQYEKGRYTVIPFAWNDKAKILTIAAKQGRFEGSLNKRMFNIVLVKPGTGNGLPEAKTSRTVVYSGKSLIINHL